MSVAIVSGSNLHIAPEQVAVDRLAGARVLVLQNEASAAAASTHGAGDAFVGTLAASLAPGDEIRTAIEAANEEAARIVSTPEADRHQRQDAPQRP